MESPAKESRPVHGPAFTLLEVITVIAIVGVLVGAGLPAYNRMKDLARSSHCVSNLRQIGIAVNDYIADHGMKLPVMVPAREDRNEDKPALDTVLGPHVNDETSFRCPADHGRLYERTGTSYFWNSALNGQHLSEVDFLGLSKNAAGIPLVADKENFHKNVGDEVNVLYVDGHVTRELTFIIEP